MSDLFLALTHWAANLVVGLCFALICLIVIGLIGGNSNLLDAPIELAVLVLCAVGWSIVSRKDLR